MSDQDTVIFKNPIPWGEFNAATAEEAEEDTLTSEEIAEQAPPTPQEIAVIQPPVDEDLVHFQQIQFRAKNGFSDNQDCRWLLNRLELAMGLLDDAWQEGYDNGVAEEKARAKPVAKKAVAKKAAR